MATTVQVGSNRRCPLLSLVALLTVICLLAASPLPAVVVDDYDGRIGFSPEDVVIERGADGVTGHVSIPYQSGGEAIGSTPEPTSALLAGIASSAWIFFGRRRNWSS